MHHKIHKNDVDTDVTRVESRKHWSDGGNNEETTRVSGSININNNNSHDEQYNTKKDEHYNTNNDDDISIEVESSDDIYVTEMNAGQLNIKPETCEEMTTANHPYNHRPAHQV